MHDEFEKGNSRYLIRHALRPALATVLAFTVFAAAMPGSTLKTYADWEEADGVVANATVIENFKIASVAVGGERGAGGTGENGGEGGAGATETGDYMIYYVLESDMKTLINGAGQNPLHVKDAVPGTAQIPPERAPGKIGGYTLAEGQNLTVNVAAGKTVSTYVLYSDGTSGADATDDGISTNGGDTANNANAPDDRANGDTNSVGVNGGVNNGFNNGAAETASYTIRFLLEDGVTPAPGIGPNPLTISGETPGPVKIPREYYPAAIADGLYTLADQSDPVVDATADGGSEVSFVYKAANGYSYKVIPCDTNGNPLDYDGKGKEIEPYVIAKPTFGEANVYFPYVEGYRAVDGQPDTVELSVYNNVENPALINLIYEYDPGWRGAEYDVSYMLYGDDTILRNYPGGAAITARGKPLGLQGVTEYLHSFTDAETGVKYRLAPDQELNVDIRPGRAASKEIYYAIDGDGTGAVNDSHTITLNYQIDGGTRALPGYEPASREIWGLRDGEKINLAFFYPTEFNGYYIISLPDGDIEIDGRDLTFDIEYEYKAPSVSTSVNYSVYHNYSVDCDEIITITPLEKNAADSKTDAPGADDATDVADADDTADAADADDPEETADADKTGAGSALDADDPEETADMLFTVYYYLSDGVTALPGREDGQVDFAAAGHGVVALSEREHYDSEAGGYSLTDNQKLSLYADIDGTSAIAVFYDSEFMAMSMEIEMEKTSDESYAVDEVCVDDKIVTGTGTPKAVITVKWPDGTKSGTRVGADGAWAVAIPDGVGLVIGDILEVTHTETAKAASSPFEATIRRVRRDPEIYDEGEDDQVEQE